ncbi:hypothetical protein ACIGO9_15880 [Nocardia asteroides]|uniref:hypothetical protein n=1 Tax=Nocardia asteroides TaxID=1824 RepID=UPI0037CC6543
MALVRADTPPESWKDLLDRQLKLISSGHWGAAQVGYFGAIIAVVIVVISAISWLVLAVGPIWTGLAGSGVLLTGAGILIAKHRSHRSLSGPPGSAEGEGQ